jgi:beta-lactamase regulating signal transducer with metallopeptidase domain
MSTGSEAVLYWLCDVYLTATIILAAAWLCLRLVREPIRRLTLSWATASALAVVVLLMCIPGRPRARLAQPQLQQQAPKFHYIYRDYAPFSPKHPEANRQWTDSVPAKPTFVPRTVTPEAGRGRTLVTTIRQVLPAPIVSFAGAAALVLAWLGLGAFEAFRLARRAVEAPASLQAILQRVIDPGFRPPALRLSDQLMHPASLGAWRPVILLPRRFGEGSEEAEVEAAITHEWAHVRRGDLWLLALLRWLMIPLAAHPLYWWLRRAIYLDQEILADADAARRSGPADYAEMLLRWCQTGGRPPQAAAILSIASRPGPLKRRIKILLDSSLLVRTSCARQWRLCVWGLAFCAAVGLSTLTLRPPRAAENPPAGEKKGMSATDRDRLIAAVASGNLYPIPDLVRRIAEQDGQKAIPFLIGVIEADNSPNTIHDVGLSGLATLTGVTFSPDHDGAWWRRWWEANRDQLPDDVKAIPIPVLEKPKDGGRKTPLPCEWSAKPFSACDGF